MKNSRKILNKCLELGLTYKDAANLLHKINHKALKAKIPFDVAIKLHAPAQIAAYLEGLSIDEAILITNPYSLEAIKLGIVPEKTRLFKYQTQIEAFKLNITADDAINFTDHYKLMALASFNIPIQQSVLFDVYSMAALLRNVDVPTALKFNNELQIMALDEGIKPQHAVYLKRNCEGHMKIKAIPHDELTPIEKIFVMAAPTQKAKSVAKAYLSWSAIENINDIQNKAVDDFFNKRADSNEQSQIKSGALLPEKHVVQDKEIFDCYTGLEDNLQPYDCATHYFE